MAKKATEKEKKTDDGMCWCGRLLNPDGACPMAGKHEDHIGGK
jgi:hypothetical protein